MKNILIIIFILSSTCLKAQSEFCPQLNSFAGEWRYINGQDTVKIYLRSHQCIITTDSTNEIIHSLWGWHEYKKGSVIIESNYANRFMTLPTNYNDIVSNSYSISLQMPGCNGVNKRLIGWITDISQCGELKVVKAQFNDAMTQLSWHQKHAEFYGIFNGCKGMTLPKDFVLTKL